MVAVARRVQSRRESHKDGVSTALVRPAGVWFKRGMDWRLLATTFATVFIAELGDKTQLATLSFATSGSSRWAVFLGSAAALVLSSLLAVLGGEALARALDPKLLQRLSGALFLLVGGWVLWSSR